MFNIDKDSIKVYKQSLFPAISFAVTDIQLEDTIPLRIEGIVLSMDWKYVANILELPDIQVRDNPLVDGRMITYGSAARPVNYASVSETEKSFKTYKSELVFTLNNKVLEHIEHLREQQKHKDTVLYLIFKSAYIKHSIKLKGYPRKYAGNDNRGGFLDNSNSSDVDTNSSSVQKILVKEDKNNDADGLIFHIVDQFRRQITIPSSEWTDNFRSQLGGK
jgi:hypothetical protein